MHLQALTTLGAWVESFEGGFPLSIFIVQLETLCNNKIAAKKNIYIYEIKEAGHSKGSRLTMQAL